MIFGSILSYFSYTNPYLRLKSSVVEFDSSETREAKAFEHKQSKADMGNICSKSANKDNFAGQGRTLGSSADNPQPRPIPANKQTVASTPGRALGGDGTTDTGDARGAAARAAEQRATAGNKSGGKLSSQLAAQKKQTQNQTLNAVSEQERQTRTADANTETRNYN